MGSCFFRSNEILPRLADDLGRAVITEHLGTGWIGILNRLPRPNPNPWLGPSHDTPLPESGLVQSAFRPSQLRGAFCLTVQSLSVSTRTCSRSNSSDKGGGDSEGECARIV